MATLDGCASAFAAELALGRGLAPKTLEAYGRDIRGFLSFAAGRGCTVPAALTRADVTAFLDSLRTAGRTAATRARAFVSVKSFVRYLKDERWIPRDLCEGLDAPKKDLRLPRVLDPAATTAILATASGENPRDLRDRAIIELLYGCGLRVSELCGLELTDILGDAGVLRCRGKGSKERIVPFGIPAARALGRYLQSARDGFARGNADERHLFVTRLGKAFTRMGIFKMLRERAELAGVDPSSVSPHVLRHCFATDLLAGGADIRVIQELLGHASVATTQIYTHVDRARLGRVHRTYHPRAEERDEG